MNSPANVAIVLFDGDCAFCNGCVRWLLKHERRSRYQFAPLQSAVAKPWLEKYGLSTSDFNSVIAIDGQQAFIKSSAALHLLKEAHRYWHLLRILKIIPRPIRDAVYDYVGKNRYQWWGSASRCVIAEPQWQSRLLTDSGTDLTQNTNETGN